jgi:hypothetical protein
MEKIGIAPLRRSAYHNMLISDMQAHIFEF